MLSFYLTKRRRQKYTLLERRTIKVELTLKYKELNSSFLGFEQWCNLTLKFRNGRHATFYYDWSAVCPWSAYISGTNGQIQIPNYCWSPTEYLKHTNYTAYCDRHIEKFEFPFQDDKTNYRLIHSEGLWYEADHVFDQISKG